MNPTQKVTPATTDELEEIWASEDVLLRATRKNKIHLPNRNGEARCSRGKVTDLGEKDPCVIPKGHWPICGTCLQQWRGEFNGR